MSTHRITLSTAAILTVMQDQLTEFPADKPPSPDETAQTIQNLLTESTGHIMAIGALLLLYSDPDNRTQDTLDKMEKALEQQKEMVLRMMNNLILGVEENHETTPAPGPF